jgi:MFS family permease
VRVSNEVRGGATADRGLRRIGLGAALAAAVALVLADSSVVVLALPAIYRRFDVSVGAVVWVLLAFNLVLAAAAVPAAAAARRSGPARALVAGLIAFAAGCLGCALSTALAPLVAARCLQALGGAAAVTAALELLPAAVGSERRAAAVWATAGAIGAALGPATGGLLTELVSWQSIFLVQIPVAILVAGLAAPIARREAEPVARANEVRASGRPHLAANLALALVSAALAAALFLIVLLLIEGWRQSPIVAAIAVSVMPAAAFAARPLARSVADARARAGAGAILVAGGLAGLGLLPRALIVATIPSQVLVGVGLALVLSALTETALAGRAPQAIHGGWTIAARHAGVVLGLAVLTPIFTSDLVEQRDAAEQAGTAALLDARLPATFKIDLAGRLHDQLAAEDGKVPVVGPAFQPLPADRSERRGALALEATLQDQLDRAATHAFSASFLIAAAFALAALAPIALSRGRVGL